MAARNTQITIVNGTKYILSLASSNLQHGIWNGGPVNIVAQHTIRVVANNESDGFMTGDQGSLSYDLLDGSTKIGTINVAWDNPWNGSNAYGCTAPQGIYIAQQEGGSGNNAAVTFVLCEAKPYSGS